MYKLKSFRGVGKGLESRIRLPNYIDIQTELNTMSQTIAQYYKGV
jgi:alpha-D-ribose 1-methylphosphonate 5-triphosphate synthase subunit PhnI